VTTDPAACETFTDLSVHCHGACFVCGQRSQDGLGLRFTEEADGSVVGCFACDERYQGYPDRLHGGVIAMLLDAAMTHCLFVRDIMAVTGSLKLRMTRLAEVGVPACLRAWLVRSAPPGYLLKAELSQIGIVRATAEGLFVERQALEEH